MKHLSLVAFFIASISCSAPPERRVVSNSVAGSGNQSPVKTGDSAQGGNQTSTQPSSNPSDDTGSAGGTGDTDENSGNAGETNQGDSTNPDDGSNSNNPDGAQLFSEGCAGCHSAGSLQGTSANAIMNAINKIGVMKSLASKYPLTNGSNADIEEIAKFLSE